MTKKYLLSFKFFALVTFFLLKSNSYSQLYTNGPISTGAVSTSSSVAPTGYTWSEMQSPNIVMGLGVYYSNSAAVSVGLADDFVVPANTIWNLTNVNVFVYQYNYFGTTIPVDVLRIRIWNGDPSSPTSTIVAGDLTTNVLNASDSGEAFVYRTSANTSLEYKIWKINASITVALPAGTYWLEYQGHASNNLSINSSPVTILNTLGNPTWNAKRRNDTTWTTQVDPNSNNTMAVPFELIGTALLSTTSNEFSSKVTLYPNPATNSITISDASNSIDGVIEISDMSGRIVKSIRSTVVNNLTINISELTSGSYILKLQSENGVSTKKLLKQ
ncbi:MAG TPA: T9SS type A sorting domain-containing protein [Flavobacterium sp.]|nr:T9SS type A sorting domain-containing protein [Flavobacterium sp.]